MRSGDRTSCVPVSGPDQNITRAVASGPWAAGQTRHTWFLLPVVTTGVSSHSLCLDSRPSVSLFVCSGGLDCRSAPCEPLNGGPPRVAAPSSCSSTWIQTESELMDNKRWSGLMDARLQVATAGECDVGDLAQRGACRTLTAAHYTFRRMKGPQAVMQLLTLVSVYWELKHSAVCTHWNTDLWLVDEPRQTMFGLVWSARAQWCMTDWRSSSHHVVGFIMIRLTESEGE